MFTKTKKQGKRIAGKALGIHYLHGGNACYSPFKGDKGIQCSGDRFDYIVEWQAKKEIQQQSLMNSLYV